MIQTKFVHDQVIQFPDTIPQPIAISLSALNSNQKGTISSFAQYKLNAVKFEFYPRQNVAGQTATGTGITGGAEIGPLRSLFVNNRDENYPSDTKVLENPRHRTHMPFRKFTRYTKLRAQIDVSMGGDTDITMLAKNMFISATDTDAIFGRFIVNRVSSGGITPTYQVVTTFYVTLRNLNHNL